MRQRRSVLDPRCRNCKGCDQCNTCPKCGTKGRYVRVVPGMGFRCLTCVTPEEHTEIKNPRVCPYCQHGIPRDAQRCPCRGSGPYVVIEAPSIHVRRRKLKGPAS